MSNSEAWVQVEAPTPREWPQVRAYIMRRTKAQDAELTRLRTANAAMRAECKAWRAYEAFIEDGAKSNTESANHHDRIGECRQLTDSTPGAMEGAHG